MKEVVRFSSENCTWVSEDLVCVLISAADLPTLWPWATQNNLLFFKMWLLILTVSSFSMRHLRLELQTFVLLAYLFLIRVLIKCAISVAGKLSWTLSPFIKMCQIPQSLEQSSNNGKRDPESWIDTNMCQRRCLLITICSDKVQQTRGYTFPHFLLPKQSPWLHSGSCTVVRHGKVKYTLLYNKSFQLCLINTS